MTFLLSAYDPQYIFLPSVSGLVSGIIARQDVVSDVFPPIPIARFFVEDLSEKRADWFSDYEYVLYVSSYIKQKMF